MSGKSIRGFGAMDREKQRQIASKGGRAAHQKGTAHEFTPEEAREAGRKGGQAAHRKGTAHQFTPQEAAEAGRKGGRAAHQKNLARRSGSGMGMENPSQQVPGTNGNPPAEAPAAHQPMSGPNGQNMPQGQAPSPPQGEVAPASVPAGA